MDPVVCLNLSNRHEAQTILGLNRNSAAGKRLYAMHLLQRVDYLMHAGPIPALVLTGFLGSGKTTVVRHLLKNRGALKIAVLINEVGSIDIDSLLVNSKQHSAASGLPAADLSGGCACCTTHEELMRALRGIAAETVARPDYLVCGYSNESAHTQPCFIFVTLLFLLLRFSRLPGPPIRRTWRCRWGPAASGSTRSSLL